MIVTMSTKIGGFRNEAEWPDVGESIDLPDHEAADLIAAGYARLAADGVTVSGPAPVAAGSMPTKPGELLAWVDGDSDRARAALAAEQTRTRPRRGVVRSLESLIQEANDEASPAPADPSADPADVTGPDGAPAAPADPAANDQG